MTRSSSIGRVIGKPPGWERVVRALAPPSRFVGGTPHPTPVPDGYVFPSRSAAR